MSQRIKQSARRHSPLIIVGLIGAVVIILGLVLALVSLKTYNERGIAKSLPEPITNAELKLGVNAYLEQYDDDDLALNLADIASTGFTAVKQSFYYDLDFDWAASDRLVEAVSASGLELVPLLDGNPEDDFAPPDNPDDFAKWAGAFANRYSEQINSYIIWDEPNLTTHWGLRPVNPADYSALLSAASSAIRDEDSTAVIIAAPLAPTTETGDRNLADSLYLEAMYQSGATQYFNVVAGKPYGFDSGPEDRRVDLDTLNFSRAILLREVMERYGDTGKAIWAGNWGWNALPDAWQGSPSIWGQVDEKTQAQWTVAALERARREWPWMGHMFLESWRPDVPMDDPHWGFSIAGRQTADALADIDLTAGLAYPGFVSANLASPAQTYEGQWRFSPEFGADVGDSGDRVTFNFWGTKVGLRIRRADQNARFYVTVDGLPANELPVDDVGAALVLNSAEPGEESLSTEVVADDLEAGQHSLTITALRGTDQWALNGFSTAYEPPNTTLTNWIVGLILLAALLVVIAIYVAWNSDWDSIRWRFGYRYSHLTEARRIALTSAVALTTAVAGWLAWSEQATGIIRKLGDGGQIAVTALAASTFYFAPSLVVYLIALALLFGLIYLRPQWGLALVAFSIPFFVKPKPMLGYRFSPLEVFLVVTLAAFVVRLLVQRLANSPPERQVVNPRFKFRSADYSVLALGVVATISLFFTQRLDVATNEWRVLIVESILFYMLLRWMWLKERESWTILDAYILGAVVVAALGLWQYATGQNLITSEGGLMRLRSVYGSPNNVALFLGRTVPLLVAFLVMGNGRRKLFYSLALLPIGLAMILSFSKGALFLGLPASLLVVLVLWRRSQAGRLWPWLVGFALAGLLGLLVALQIPQLAGRLNPQGATGFFRMNLWLSSWNMFVDHPFFGVGLDNFLYQYRSRYIMDAAWQEPNLNHPHNVFLDFATRLGLAGILAGLWLLFSYLRVSLPLPSRSKPPWQPVAIGIVGAIVYTLAHGLVDHSFFLVDLAFTFFLMFGLAIWIDENQTVENATVT